MCENKVPPKIDFWTEVRPLIISFRKLFGRSPTHIELQNMIREIHLKKIEEE